MYKFIYTCNPHYNQDTEHFHHPQILLHSIPINVPFLVLETTDLLSVPIVLW